MRIQSQQIIAADDIHLAVSRARYEFNQDIWLDCDADGCAEITVGARGAIEFHCHSTWGKYASGRRDNPNGYRAASWTAWGYVIAHLFTVNPEARIGHYRSRDHFIRTIYGEQRRYILRHRLGLRGDTGSDCSFLHLFTDEQCEQGYNAMRSDPTW